MNMIVKCDTDDVGHENVCTLHINNVVQCLICLYLECMKVNANYSANQVSIKRNKQDTQNMLLVMKYMDSSMKTVRTSIDFIPFT